MRWSWFRPFTGRQAPDRIVVGVDGSPNSIDALVWAVRQASTTGANVEAVMCWHDPPSNGMEISVLDADWAVGAGAALKPALEQVPRAVQVRIPPTIAYGRATEILVARSMKPSHSWSARGPRFSGRGATRLGQQHVITHARCPVVVVKPSAMNGQKRWSRPRNSVASTAT